MLTLLGNDKVIYSRDGMDKSKLGTGKEKAGGTYKGECNLNAVAWEGKGVTNDFAIVILDKYYPKEGIEIMRVGGKEYTLKFKEAGTARFRVYYESGSWKTYEIEVKKVPEENTVQYTLYALKENEAILEFGWVSKEGEFYEGGEKEETSSTDRQAFIANAPNKNEESVFLRLPDELDFNGGLPIFIQTDPVVKDWNTHLSKDGLLRDKFRETWSGSDEKIIDLLLGSDIIKWAYNNTGLWTLTTVSATEFGHSAGIDNINAIVYQYDKMPEPLVGNVIERGGYYYRTDGNYEGFEEGTYTTVKEHSKRTAITIPKGNANTVTITKKVEEEKKKEEEKNTELYKEGSVEAVLNRRLAEKGENLPRINKWGYINIKGDWVDSTTDPTKKVTNSDETAILACRKPIGGKDYIFVHVGNGTFVSKNSVASKKFEDAKNFLEVNDCGLPNEEHMKKLLDLANISNDDTGGELLGNYGIIWNGKPWLSNMQVIDRYGETTGWIEASLGFSLGYQATYAAIYLGY